jgi:hypothetical protein
MASQELIARIEAEAKQLHIEPKLAKTADLYSGTHVFLLFNDGEIVFTKCGESGYMFGDRNFHCFHPAITNSSLPVQFPMPWKNGLYTCVAVNDEVKAKEMREKLRQLL